MIEKFFVFFFTVGSSRQKAENTILQNTEILLVRGRFDLKMFILLIEKSFFLGSGIYPKFLWNKRINIAITAAIYSRPMKFMQVAK